ncbi:MAG TPA: hypothetical protein PLH94_10350 [Fimbriimonadaceae bacterium]|nr:hypothetical protein [Fimbriimonadaceae bacterium]
MTSNSERTVLAIDPGSAKCGLALVRRDGQAKLVLLWRAICPTEDVLDKLQEASEVAPYQMIIVGAGTRSYDLVHRLREHMPGIGILVVDERDTTQQARERYWEHNPRRGLRRLLPASMWVPPEPVDDYAALIIAERVLTDSS